VATYKFFDRADEFRIEIIGRLTGPGVQDVKQAWEEALRKTTPRRFCVDISRLSGYDASGCKLLAEMYRHGTEIAARTPSSLVFLNEIANTPRGPAVLVSAPIRKPENKVARDTVRGIAAL
jgi:ABC-type transporter Mla MlaB component